MESALRDARRHHVGYQYRVSIDKTANGIVAVTRLWADEPVSSPLCVWRYTPAPRLAGGDQHSVFRTRAQWPSNLPWRRGRLGFRPAL